VTPIERKTATRFRLSLRDLGFDRVQFSVYARNLPSLEAIMDKVKLAVPTEGCAWLLELTDAQYEGIVRLHNGAQQVFEKPKALVTF
jgi:CRISPR-associated protein Cas2